MNIPLVNIKAQYAEVGTEIENKVLEILRSTWYILGNEGKELEKEVADFTDAGFGAGVRSGTEALFLGLRALGVKAGDEVITTPFTFIATAEVISYLGATPVFVDIEEDSFCIDVTKIEEKITDKTKVIMPVHLYGQSADMDPIMEIAKKHNLKVLADACQSIGTTYKGKGVGGIGDCVGFSFFPTKNLGACGEGGMVTTNDESLLEEIKVLRAHGMRVRYEHETIGYNSRLDEIQCATLRVKLRKLAAWTKKRQANAKFFIDNLSGIDGLRLPITKEYSNHVYHQFTLRYEKRDELLAFLQERGVGSAIHYPKPIHLQPAYSFLGIGEGSFPVSEKVSKDIFSIPVYPELSQDELDYIVATIKEFFSK